MVLRAARRDQVLVVDDDEEVANSVAEVLESQGIPASTARSWLQALQLFDSIRPSLLIVDHGLPGMSGDSLVRLLREKFTGAVGPVLFLTGSPSAVHALPPDIVLEKPAELDVLVATVRSLLEQREQGMKEKLGRLL